MVFKERFDTPVFLRFVRRLLKQAAGKVFLIVDGHPVHRASKDCNQSSDLKPSTSEETPH
jgi:hypothetical protein